jgi:hypothetical protein
VVRQNASLVLRESERHGHALHRSIL